MSEGSQPSVPSPGGVRAFIGLGSNLDDPVRQVRRGIAALRALGATRVVACSSLYRSRPLGDADQPPYVNAVVSVETRLDARALLARLHGIESAQGRERGARWASRTLDLDLLVHGDAIERAPDLSLPHPGIATREFVLIPLYEIAPALVVPGLGPIAPLALACERRGLERLDADGRREAVA